MELQLKNIGMIKEANVKIDGLTVIAGENDTGKSTVGKALFALLKARLFVLNSKLEYSATNSQYLNKIEWLFNKISKKQLLKNNTFIKIEDIEVDFSKRSARKGNRKFFDGIFIETPFIFNLYQTLSGINKANSIIDFEIEYNYLWWDLYIKLSQKAKTFSDIDFGNILFKIENITHGSFRKYDEISKDKWVFVKSSNEFEMDNVAMGIKQFAIIYALIKNGYLTKDRILIFDEPEVHLHPKWQLEMAKVIVELVKNGVKVVVNSHSPYMIEALKKYAEVENVYDKTNFYLAEDEYIKQLEDSNAVTLSKIFEKLSEPFDIFEEMESDSLEKLING